MPDSIVNKKIFDLILKSNKILLISHQRPDGDTLGAGLAMANFLDRLGKARELFSVHRPSPYFYFLPKVEDYKNNETNLDLRQFDLLITLDCADLSQTGIKEKILELNGEPTLINIDHHKTNPNYGYLNLVTRDASSTCEVVYSFLTSIGAHLDKNIATCLLTGIMTDTDNFTNAATTTSSLRAASDLLREGASFNQIIQNTSKNKTLASLKLWGKVLSRLKENEAGLVSTVITLEDMRENQLTADALEGIANFLNNLSGTRTVLVLREEPNGAVKGSMRSNDEKVDVSAIAKIFGGGGHRGAAGFTIKGRLVETEGEWKVV